uniref:Uncharacterized protein n=1 Tax=Leersia perrieri TaxID=77586 RepID=A0A0D9WQK0_9ORYZ
MAAECGVDVHVVEFLPGRTSAGRYTFLGAPTAAAEEEEEEEADQAAKKAAAMAAVRGLVEKDVSKMTMEEAKAHHARLMELRAAVIRRL